MEVRVTTKKVVALILNEDEAKWLKGIMQNPLSGNPDPNDEDHKDRDNRIGIFYSLDGAGI